ncbi:hypothetical protein [Methanolobus sp.]|uniref:COG1361 S-layer family protein n=1 Tax=Methanolobus sp. TaxID=1874737 RepID=UPI0025D16B4A|nr:hypothetical protein [Methanolobus sp.]
MSINDKMLLRRFSLVAAGLCILMAAVIPMMSVSAAKEFIPPAYELTTNYYRSYGEPDISVSVLGDTELERGETANLEIVLSNRGIFYGVKSITNVGTSNSDHAQSLQELEYEKLRTTAYGIKTGLVSGTEYIMVDSATSSQTLKDPLYPGTLPENPLVYTVTVSNNAPAGVYMLEMPISYEYQSDVRMTGGKAVTLGLPDLDHVKYYTPVNKTLYIPVIVKPAAKFEVMAVSGGLVAGRETTVNITYANVGDFPATDAVARVILMKPLSVDSSVHSLGTIMPGESRTVSFSISSDGQALDKTYALDTEIKYRDTDDNLAYSGNMKANVRMQSPERQFNITRMALAGILIMCVVLVIKSLKKNRKG